MVVLLTSISNFSHRTFLELIKTVYGINYSRATYVAAACGISPFVRVRKVPERTMRKVEAYILSRFKVGRDARQILQANIKKLQNIFCYRALRMEQGLPARGQRTRSNSKTAKKFGRIKNLYFKADVHRFRSNDPRKGYVRKGRKGSIKPIFKHGTNAKFNAPAGTIPNKYKVTRTGNKSGGWTNEQRANIIKNGFKFGNIEKLIKKKV